ncbi:GNAT family N-acetyltransferase [uncultured Sphingomonas sp.]|uniref:GNAT family N-acetyltransferase n=1 Tax=uncultured Sphingomonas sp. TaxID=158754 RepID=UPI002637CB17|nr:GNAT family N-acetyltransferase [uncultured Sphingomonas sp.]
MPEYQWRAMTADDLPTVAAISDRVHGDFTEDGAVYAERLALYPAGCLVLAGQREIAGYLIAHPWHRATPPALGATLGAIPADADSYYLHDIALLPSARGSGAGRTAIGLAMDQARAAGLGEIALIAVNGADKFWAAQGFVYAGPAPYGADTWLMHRPVARG